MGTGDEGARGGARACPVRECPGERASPLRVSGARLPTVSGAPGVRPMPRAGWSTFVQREPVPRTVWGHELSRGSSRLS